MSKAHWAGTAGWMTHTEYIAYLDLCAGAWEELGQPEQAKTVRSKGTSLEASCEVCKEHERRFGSDSTDEVQHTHCS